jgi:hypothetical protein
VLQERGTLKERKSNEAGSPEDRIQHESLINRGTCGEWIVTLKKIHFEGIGE